MSLRRDAPELWAELVAAARDGAPTPPSPPHPCAGGAPMTDENPHFLLDGERNVHPATYEEWAEWRRTTRKTDLAQWQVGKTNTATAQVSTVFTGWDLRVWGEGPPQPFETLVFGGALADECERSSTWAEAEAAHTAMVERVREAEAAAQAADPTPTVTSTAAEASTAVPPDPRAIMAALGVSCATCQWWTEPYAYGAVIERHLGGCARTPEGRDMVVNQNGRLVLNPDDAGTTAAVHDRYLLTRADHFCAMWERRP